ncbi:MAG: hypothetical protein Q9227_006767 [Pyrenula ochraceoflavens]
MPSTTATTYGSLPTPAPNGDANTGNNSETSTLLPPPNKPAPRPSSQRLYKHLTVRVSRARADLLLLLSYIITGLLDSSAIFIWGSFVSMQTGNTVYVGLGLADPKGSTRWIKSAVSIACFCAGSFCFSRFHNFFSPRRRWVLSASYATQLVLIVAAAVIVTLDEKSEQRDKSKKELRWDVLVPLGLVAFQSSGQAVTSRALQYGSLTSVVLTSIYCDLWSDPALFTAPLTENLERNRRAAAPVLLLIGALLGGVWAHSSVGLPGALWTAAAIKGVIVVAWLVWKTEPEDVEELVR